MSAMRRDQSVGWVRTPPCVRNPTPSKCSEMLGCTPIEALTQLTQWRRLGAHA